MRLLYVIAGAGVGAPARFLIDQFFRKFTDKPVGIFAVNTIGSLFIGYTYARPGHWHDLFAIGFAGSFTTWSTLIIDIYLAFELKKYRDAALNLVGSIAFGLLFAWIGIALAR